MNNSAKTVFQPLHEVLTRHLDNWNTDGDNANSNEVDYQLLGCGSDVNEPEDLLFGQIVILDVVDHHLQVRMRIILVLLERFLMTKFVSDALELLNLDFFGLHN
jgi:hypothetical protein